MEKIVAKFGGSSLANGKQFCKVRDILALDDRRVFVIPSAPGRRFNNDKKVTDMLLSCYALNEAGKPIDDTFEEIILRFQEIKNELNLSVDLESVLSKIEKDIKAGASMMYCASRGEFVNGMLLADFLNYTFLDPAEAILFNENGVFDSEQTNRILAQLLVNLPNAVIPGFYGSKANGEICTFSRGGSDITGAIVARAANAKVYENWTDVSGFLMADPRIVNDPLEISEITYSELRELSYMGATVLHEDAIFPVHKANISTNIRNTNFPQHPGTMIHSRSHNEFSYAKDHIITGIAGKQGFDIIAIEKAMMNSELGFGSRVLQVLEEFKISFEHLPTGIDTMSIVISHESLAPHKEEVIEQLIKRVEPDSINVFEDLALIATVGRGMINKSGSASRLFYSLYKKNINIRMIDQGSSELSILVSVSSKDFEKAITSIYNIFVHNDPPFPG